MVQSPSWEANRFSTNQETPRILWNPKVHHRTPKRPPPVPILSQLDPVHIPKSHLLEIHLNIILPPTPRSPKLFLSLSFPTKTLYMTLLSRIRTTCTAHLNLLGFTTRALFGEVYRSLSSSLCSFLHSPVTSCLLDPNILLKTLFPNTLRLLYSLNVHWGIRKETLPRYQFIHPKSYLGWPGINPEPITNLLSHGKSPIVFIITSALHTIRICSTN